MIPWTEQARRETKSWLAVLWWPVTVAWWLFVDYVWPYLWRIAIGLLFGVGLGVIVRTVYFGETLTWP